MGFNLNLEVKQMNCWRASYNYRD